MISNNKALSGKSVGGIVNQTEGRQKADNNTGFKTL